MSLFGHAWVEAEDGQEYRLDVEVTPGRPAKTYGLPENCYPEEPSELADCTLSGPVPTTQLTGPVVAQGESEIEWYLKKIGAVETFADLCESASIDAWEE